ncbi:serine/threonine-protein kinase [Nocardiopsis quinghaiensis]|uniref:serine/threonine-protein kinase n=1 Tax=Nocardiopsis quinghaiensis TaxID=464995 RepID=UPI001CC239ED|nr:serine/threonine-protein kinase [Nocardiopsis quinghaiensis]
MTTPLLPSDPVRIGPYAVAARIDSGGQGTVYLAHASDGSPAAVKVLTRSWADDTRQRGRFAKELAAARRVAPFCTAAVLDADMHADVPFIASEYVPGPTLRSAVRDEGPRTGPALDRLAIATVTALTAVHEAGVVHRDLKPGNVILGPDGPRVIDFGIASLVDATQQTTTVAGTPSYMSPEQVRGGLVGPSSDMFSWAAVIAYAATGHHAFPGEDTMAVIDRVLTAPPDLSGVPDRLLPVLEACLAKDPVSRPAAVKVLGALIGRDGGLTAPVAATRILAEASTAVDDGTARIRLPERGWAETGSGHGPPSSEVAGGPSGAAPTTRDLGLGGSGGLPGGARHDGGPGDGPTAPGGRARSRRPGGRGGPVGWALAGALVVLAVIGYLSPLWPDGPWEMTPTGSTPPGSSPPPADESSAAEGEPVTNEEPVTGREGPAAEEAPVDTGAEESTSPGPGPGTDCTADPYAPGCPSPDDCGHAPCDDPSSEAPDETATGTDGTPGDGDGWEAPTSPASEETGGGGSGEAP